MVNSRHFLVSSILCLAFLGGDATAQALTAVSDTVTKPNGDLFNGIVQIRWTGGSGGSIAPTTSSARAYNGLLSVLLVPTTTISPCAYYYVTFTTDDGQTRWTQLWYVPPSNVTLTINQVTKISSGCTPGGDSGGDSGTVTLPIQMTDVTGLTAALAGKPNKSSTYSAGHAAVVDGAGNLSTAAGSSGDCVHVDGSTGPCGSGSGSLNVAFVDGETPSGTLDGTNLTFTLSQAPSPITSFELFHNGILMQAGEDFSLSASTITFFEEAIPRANDTLLAYYRVAGTTPAVTFVDGEIPSGALDGANISFNLASAPTSGSVLRLYKNGVLLQASLDYTLSGTAITFINSAQPNSGDTLLAYYRR
jgi:hypothetical protein